MNGQAARDHQQATQERQGFQEHARHDSDDHETPGCYPALR